MDVLIQGINKKAKVEQTYNPDQSAYIPPTTTLGFDPSQQIPANPIISGPFDPNNASSYMPTVETVANTSQKSFTQNVIVTLKQPVSFYKNNPPNGRYHPVILLNGEKCALALVNYRLHKKCIEDQTFGFEQAFHLIRILGIQRNTEESRYEDNNPFFMDDQYYNSGNYNPYDEGVWRNESVSYDGIVEVRNIWRGVLTPLLTVGLLLIRVRNHPRNYRFTANMSERHEFSIQANESVEWIWQLVPAALPKNFTVTDMKNHFGDDASRYDFNLFSYYKLGDVKLEKEGGIHQSEWDVVDSNKAGLVTIFIKLDEIPSLCVKP